MLLSWEHWLDPRPGYPSFLYTLLLLVYAFGLGLCLTFYFFVAPRRFGSHALKRKVAETAAWRGGWLSLIGLVLLMGRHAEIPFLSIRLLTYTLVLTTIASLFYLGYYLKNHYPQELARYERQQRRGQRRSKRKR